MPPSDAVTHDARGHATRLAVPPQRIVSLVPSLTELLAALGLGERVVGLTRFCVRPEGWKDSRTIVGGTKNVRVKRVVGLAPDLVIANREENTREDVEALEAAGLTVHVTDVADMAGACATIRDLGRLVGEEEKADALAGDIKAAFAALPEREPAPRVAYLIWRAPYMSVGRDTIIHDVLRRGGFRNAFVGQTRYPATTAAELAALDLDAIFLSSEPYPFGPKHVEELKEQLPSMPILLVDGEPFSWYGPSLLRAPEEIARIHEHLAR